MWRQDHYRWPCLCPSGRQFCWWTWLVQTKYFKRLTDHLTLKYLANLRHPQYFDILRKLFLAHTHLWLLFLSPFLFPRAGRPFSVRPSSFPWRQFRSFNVVGSRQARQPFGDFWLGLEAFEISSCFVSFLNTKKINKKPRELSVQRGEGLWKFHLYNCAHKMESFWLSWNI